MQLWCSRFHRFLLRKNIRYLPSASDNISCISSWKLRTPSKKWSQLRLTSLMATCSLLYRFFPDKNRVKKWVIKSFYDKTRSKNTVKKTWHMHNKSHKTWSPHSGSYQVGVHQSFHIQSFCRRENSVQPSLRQNQTQSYFLVSVCFLGTAEKLFYLARGRSPFRVWTAYRRPPRCPRSKMPSMWCLKSLSSPTGKP